MARSRELFVEVQGLDPENIAPFATQIWAGLAFDDEARATLKRDGLMLDGLRLTGPMPFMFTSAGAARVHVTVPDKSNSDALLDLFRVWLLPRLRAATVGDDAP